MTHVSQRIAVRVASVALLALGVVGRVLDVGGPRLDGWEVLVAQRAVGHLDVVDRDVGHDVVRDQVCMGRKQWQM